MKTTPNLAELETKRTLKERGILSTNEILEMEIPEITYYIEGLLRPGGKATLVAKKKMAKSKLDTKNKAATVHAPSHRDAEKPVGQSEELKRIAMQIALVKARTEHEKVAEKSQSKKRLNARIIDFVYGSALIWMIVAAGLVLIKNI